MRDEDKILVLSLVRDHILGYPGYVTWVPPHVSTRWVRRQPQAILVMGYFRRRALYMRLLAALECTCRLQALTYEVDRNYSASDCVLMQLLHTESETLT